MFPSTAAVAVTLFTTFALLSIPYPITALKTTFSQPVVKKSPARSTVKSYYTLISQISILLAVRYDVPINLS